jgi:hypothetical protein
MRTSFKWIVVSLVLFGACLFAYARFSTLASDLEMHKFMEQNNNRVRHTIPRPPQDPPACFTDDCRARQVITI